MSKRLLLLAVVLLVVVVQAEGEPVPTRPLTGVEDPYGGSMSKMPMPKGPKSKPMMPKGPKSKPMMPKGPKSKPMMPKNSKPKMPSTPKTTPKPTMPKMPHTPHTPHTPPIKPGMHTGDMPPMHHGSTGVGKAPHGTAAHIPKPVPAPVTDDEGVGASCDGGTCQDVNSYSCSGQFVSGECPGDWNIQCCQPADGIGASCDGGVCQDANSYSCSGSFVTGLCPGPSNVQCCQAEEGVGSSCGSGGTCQDVNTQSCSGSYVQGECPGDWNIQCCQSGGGGGAAPSGGGSCGSFADSQVYCADPSCSSSVSDGDSQDSYMCAEFVARSLASAGYIPGLSAGDPQGAYSSYTYSGNTYDLCWTSSKQGVTAGLEDFLIAAGWGSGGSINDCSVVFVDTDSPYSHVAIGVGPDTLDAHNNARYHVSGSYYDVDAVYNP